MEQAVAVHEEETWTNLSSFTHSLPIYIYFFKSKVNNYIKSKEITTEVSPKHRSLPQDCLEVKERTKEANS